MDLKLRLMMAMVIWKKMIICVRGSVYDVDACVATSLSSECIYDVALFGASEGDFLC